MAAMETKFVIRRAFGGAIAPGPGVYRGRLTEQIDEGRPPLSGGLSWTHFLDVGMAVDIRDGQTRAAGTNVLTYADGDEIRIPDDNGCKFVVVLVVRMAMGSMDPFKRAYLMRDDPVFTGTFWK